MSKTNIEWCDNSWNPVTGCTKISAGCANCYAERMSKRLRGRCGYPALTPFVVTPHPKRMNEPLKLKKPKRIFVCSMGDLFHDDVPDWFIDKVFAVMAAAPQHTFLVLTKRPKDMHDYIAMAMGDTDCNYEGWYEELDKLGIPDATPLENVHLGVSVEDQATADERIPLLLQTPAAKRFVSIEPMLGSVDLTEHFFVGDCHCNERTIDDCSCFPSRGIHGVILGGETGPGARPMHPDWPRKVRDDCKAAGVPFMFKQWGEWAPDCLCKTKRPHKSVPRPQPGIMGAMFRCGKKGAGHLLDGVEHREVANGN